MNERGSRGHSVACAEPEQSTKKTFDVSDSSSGGWCNQSVIMTDHACSLSTDYTCDVGVAPTGVYPRSPNHHRRRRPTRINKLMCAALGISTEESPGDDAYDFKSTRMLPKCPSACNDTERIAITARALRTTRNDCPHDEAVRNHTAGFWSAGGGNKQLGSPTWASGEAQVPLKTTAVALYHAEVRKSVNRSAGAPTCRCRRWQLKCREVITHASGSHRCVSRYTIICTAFEVTFTMASWRQVNAC